MAAFKKAVEPLTTHSLQGSDVQPVVLRPGRQAGPGDNSYLDTTRLTDDTGFAAAFDIAAAVADYVAWRAANPR
jgi:hypothetical protein